MAVSAAPQTRRFEKRRCSGRIVAHSEKAGVAAAIEPAHEERYRTISEADWTLPQGREGLKRNAETALAGTGIPRQGYRDIRPRIAEFRAASFRLPLVQIGRAHV